MITLFIRRSRLVRFALVFALGTGCAVDAAPKQDAPTAPPAVAGELTMHDDDGVLVIQFGGRDGSIGIPSWRVVVPPESGGTLTTLHVPADNPVSLGSRTQLMIVSGRNDEGIAPHLYKGREAFTGLRPETFEVLEQTPGRIVIHLNGRSRNGFYIHDRTYTFTPEGVQIEGWIDPLVNLAVVSFMPHFDRRQLADSHMGALPMRTQGRHGWVYMRSAGQDGSASLPEGVDFPLEMELKLRLETPTFLRVFYDQPFDAAVGSNRFVHNNRDMFLNSAGRVLYEKLTGITGFPVPKGARQNFKARFVFENRIPSELPAIRAGSTTASH